MLLSDHARRTRQEYPRKEAHIPSGGRLVKEAIFHRQLDISQPARHSLPCGLIVCDGYHCRELNIGRDAVIEVNASFTRAIAANGGPTAEQVNFEMLIVRRFRIVRHVRGSRQARRSKDTEQ